MNSVLFKNVMNTSEGYAQRRKYAHRVVKKITRERLFSEIAIARVLGELNSAERILEAIVDHKDWDREMIEAELHLFVKELAEVAGVYLEGKKVFDLEDILREYGYYKKEETEQ